MCPESYCSTANKDAKTGRFQTLRNCLPLKIGRMINALPLFAKLFYPARREPVKAILFPIKSRALERMVSPAPCFRLVFWRSFLYGHILLIVTLRFIRNRHLKLPRFQRGFGIFFREIFGIMVATISHNFCLGTWFRTKGQYFVMRGIMWGCLDFTLRPHLFHGNRGQRDNGAEHIALNKLRRPAGVELCVFKLHDLFRKNVFIQVINYRKNVCNTLCKTQKNVLYYFRAKRKGGDSHETKRIFAARKMEG